MTGIDGHDWSVFGGANPVPGDPDQVRQAATILSGLASEADGQNRVIRSVGADSSSVWTGAAAERFRPHVTKLNGQIDKLVTSYGRAAEAMHAYWPKLSEAQDLAVQALVQARSAQGRMASAANSVRDTEASLGQARAAYNQAAGAAHPEASKLAGLQASYQSSQDAARSAESALESAQSDLRAAEALKDHAVQLATAAASALAAQLREASAEGIHNPHHSWFSSLVGDIEGVAEGGLHWVEHNWEWVVPGGAEVMAAFEGARWLSHNWVHVLQDASAVLGGVATVAGFLALVPGVGEILLPVALAASLAATADDAILAATGYGQWSTVLLDGVGDLGFGAGEGLNFVAKGMNDAEELATAGEDLRSARAALEAQVQPSEEAAARWEALGDRQVIQVGRDGSAEVTKSSDLAAQFREDSAGPRQELDRTTARLAGNEEQLARLPGEGGTAGWRYSLRTFRPGEEGGTLTKVTSFFRNPSDYTDSVLHPTSGIAGQSPAGIRQLVTSEAHEMWGGAGRIPYRVAVGVGVTGTGLGAYVDQGAWRDVLSGK